jgi:hypothetical protein
LDQADVGVGGYSQGYSHVGQRSSMSQPSQSASRVVKEPLLFWLKLLMLTGIALILFGHYLWVGLQLPERMGVPGIIIVAGCCAFGLILSLPTKIYLTLLLMQRESAQQQAQLLVSNAGNSNNDCT